MQVKALCEGEPNLIANLANVSAVLFEQLKEVNWAGFYLMSDALRAGESELVLGPFQGKAACVRIPVGRGVCGTAVATRRAQLVEDVHQFEGHIACDGASNSEVVIPIFQNEQVVAVLDIDSPKLARFDQQDVDGLTELVDYLQTIWA
jgi:GAF domain-containing protein